MIAIRRILIVSISVVLLWVNLASGEQEYQRGREVGTGKHWVQFTGRVLCSGPTRKAQHTTSASRFYQIRHRRGQVVMKIATGAAVLSYHSLWLNGEDRLFEMLAAEENLFKDIVISGVLREYLPTMGIVDLPTVQVIDAETNR